MKKPPSKNVHNRPFLICTSSWLPRWQKNRNPVPPKSLMQDWVFRRGNLVTLNNSYALRFRPSVRPDFFFFFLLNLVHSINCLTCRTESPTKVIYPNSVLKGSNESFTFAFVGLPAAWAIFLKVAY